MLAADLLSLSIAMYAGYRIGKGTIEEAFKKMRSELREASNKADNLSHVVDTYNERNFELHFKATMLESKLDKKSKEVLKLEARVEDVNKRYFELLTVHLDLLEYIKDKCCEELDVKVTIVNSPLESKVNGP